MRVTTDAPKGPEFPFVQKHARFLSFLGALIVFATFIVKDAIRDNLKDLMSSLESAQASFALRSDNSTLGDKLEQVDSRIESLLSNQSKSEDAVSKRLTQTKDMLQVGMEDNQYSTFELDRIKPVVKRMNNEQYKKQLKQLASGIEKLRLSGNEIVHSFQRAMQADVGQEKDYNDAGSWVIQCRDSRAEILQFVREVLENANKKIDTDEVRIKHYTLLSYFLYTLGWGLALIGRICGLEAVGGGVE